MFTSSRMKAGATFDVATVRRAHLPRDAEAGGGETTCVCLATLKSTVNLATCLSCQHHSERPGHIGRVKLVERAVDGGGARDCPELGKVGCRADKLAVSLGTRLY